MEKHSVTIVIFGATGDLVQKKLMSALFDLYNNEIFSDDFRIVGFSRKSLSHEEYRNFSKEILEKTNSKYKEKIDSFLKNIYYHKGDLDNSDSYLSLSDRINKLDYEDGLCSNKMFYLAIPPNLYESVFKNLSESGMTIPCVNPEDNKKIWARVLVEKPFGSDMEEAFHLDKMLGKLFNENQIFRIDHYLAKETVQNILTFRFANSIFSGLWNKENIERINIKVHESFDVGNRGAFYDGIGALRDVGQNHMLQMLALITMKDPLKLDAASIRRARSDILNKVYFRKEISSENIVRAQYKGYLDVDGVKEESDTETFFRIKLGIKGVRFNKVPIYLESGKSLHQTKTEIEVVFKEKPNCACPVDDKRKHMNKLIFTIKPEDGIKIRFWIKKPGFKYELIEKDLSFMYSHEENTLPDPYERVLFDCIRGDQTLFTSTDEVKAQWKIITPICKFLSKVPLKIYKKESNPEDFIR